MTRVVREVVGIQGLGFRFCRVLVRPSVVSPRLQNVLTLQLLESLLQNRRHRVLSLVLGVIVVAGSDTCEFFSTKSGVARLYALPA